jgi:caffeoyl-CoA O-methyltransferase
MKKFESIYIDGFESYINENLVKRPFPIMKEMEIFAEENKIPILSPAAGSILKFLISSRKPKTILELGTGLGYSTAWMLSAGIPIEIDTIDRNAKELKSADFFLARIKKSSQIVNYHNVHCIEFLKIAADLSKYDFVFVDCDKICYPEILTILIENKRMNTSLLFDNVLWHGRLRKELYSKPSDLAVQEFWDIIQKKNIYNTLFPAGDGLCLIENES